MKRGLFITVEGGEGVGKSTQINLLVKSLREKQFDVIETHDPGGTLIGSKIRGIVLEKELKEFSPKAELLLFLAARAQLVSEVIRPNLKAGKIVISDRFYHSTYAYQGGARGLTFDEVKMLNEFAIDGIKPDITFLLDLPPKDGFNRMKPKTKNGEEYEEEQVSLSLHLPSNHKRINIDRIEREGDSFHEDVRKAFRKIAEDEKEIITIVDASKSIDEIALEIENRVLAMLEQRSGH